MTTETIHTGTVLRFLPFETMDDLSPEWRVKRCQKSTYRCESVRTHQLATFNIEAVRTGLDHGDVEIVSS